MKQIRIHFLEDGIGDLTMRTNNKAEMDVIEQLEGAMAEVCTNICKHYDYAHEKSLELDLSDELQARRMMQIQTTLDRYCEECPLGRISHEFVSSNDT